MGLFHKAGSFLHEVGMFLGEIIGFSNVFAEIIEGDLASEHRLADGFPIAKSHGLAATLFVEFPVKVFVVLLSVTLTEKRR